MKLRILVLLGWTAWFAPAQQPACHPVEGDRIQARDLAAALPEFGTAPPEALLGQAPLPGAQRTFHAAELRALAQRIRHRPVDRRRTSVSNGPCEPLDRNPRDRGHAGVAADSRRENRNCGPQSRRACPRAASSSRSTGWEPASPEPRALALWRGDVVYGDGHRFAIWARVDITAPCRKLVAVESLKAGRPIEAAPTPRHFGRLFSRWARRERRRRRNGRPGRRFAPSPPAAELRPELLTAANDVNRGDAVQVEVRSGGRASGPDGARPVRRTQRRHDFGPQPRQQQDLPGPRYRQRHGHCRSRVPKGI